VQYGGTVGETSEAHGLAWRITLIAAVVYSTVRRNVQGKAVYDPSDLSSTGTCGGEESSSSQDMQLEGLIGIGNC